MIEVKLDALARQPIIGIIGSARVRDARRPPAGQHEFTAPRFQCEHWDRGEIVLRRWR